MTPLKGLMWFEDGLTSSRPKTALDYIPPEEAAKQALVELEGELNSRGHRVDTVVPLNPFN
jgi:hypothetical protein